jgi:PAS domain S-box-containing protein
MSNNTGTTRRQSKKNPRNRIKNQNNKDGQKIARVVPLHNTLRDTKKNSKMFLHEREKYEYLYDSLPDLLRTIDKRNIIIDCNKTYANSLGYTKKEIIGKSIFKHTAGKSHAQIKRSIKTWKRTGRITNSEIWLKRKDGTIFPTLLSGASIYDKDGNIIGRTVSLRDITEIYKSRKDLKEKEEILQGRLQELKTTYRLVSEMVEKYRNLYDTSPILYRTIDLNGIIHDCNHAYANALGYSKKEIIGKSIFDHVAEKSTDNLKETFHTWKDKGKVGETLLWFKRKDGTVFPVMLSAVSIYDKKGELVGSNTIIRDVTDIHSAKQEAEEQKIKRLSAMGELSARIAHDLRNPLSVIKNATKLIRMQNPNLDENILNKFSFIDSAITRMSHQIDEVLDFVRPKQLSKVHTTSTEILQNVMNRIIVPDTVQVNLPSDKIGIVCDLYGMEIVFVNLIINAIQAMDYHGTINIRVSENKDNILFDIEDTGPGIPADLLPKIFDPLFTTRQIGTGLGLVSCKSIVEKHGGTITVKTVMRKGTTFTIAIPKTGNIHSNEI